MVTRGRGFAGNPNNMFYHSTDQLVDLIRKKHSVLAQLREVGCHQSTFVASGDTTALLKLLAAKQSLITALQELERQLAPFYEQDPESRVWRSPHDRAQCAQQVADCNKLLQEIVELEKSGAEKMTIRRDEMAHRLQQFHVTSQVRSAYQAQQRTSP